MKKPLLMAGILLSGFLALKPVPVEAGVKCLDPRLIRILNNMRKNIGKVAVVSTCARRKIEGTNKWSKHTYGKAIDVRPRHDYWRAVRWLKRHHNGGVISYSKRFDHIHYEIGRKFYCHTRTGSCRSRRRSFRSVYGGSRRNRHNYGSEYRRRH